MPCALTSDFAYPDYLKRILKEIKNDKDEDLKTCACKLKTPLDNEGCPIVDEDNKLAAFPFCMQWYPNIQSVPPVLDMNLCEPDNDDNEACLIPFEHAFMQVTLAQAMNIFWNLKSITFIVGMDRLKVTKTCGDLTGTPTHRDKDQRSPAEYKITRKVQFQKELVCADKFFDEKNSFTEESDTTYYRCTFSGNPTTACYLQENINIRYAIYFRNSCPGGSGGWTEEECFTTSDGVSPVVRVGTNFYIRKPAISYYRSRTLCNAIYSKISVSPTPPEQQYCRAPEDREIKINMDGINAPYYTFPPFSEPDCASLVPFQDIRVKFEFF